MKNRTKGILMVVILFSLSLLVISYFLDSYIPALFIFSLIFVGLYILKANELMNSDD